MATIKYGTPGAPANILTTELNSITNAAGAITSTALSNDAAGELHPFATFRLTLASPSAGRSAGAAVYLFLLPETSDVYSFGGASLMPLQPPDAVFILDNTTNARDVVIFGVALPPTNFHVVVWNATGATFASSGNVLAWEVYDYQSA